MLLLVCCYVACIPHYVVIMSLGFGELSCSCCRSSVIWGLVNIMEADGPCTERRMVCRGVPSSQRHRFHWITGSVFHGHRLFSEREATGVLMCFAVKADVEASAVLTGLGRKTVRHLFDRLRMAATLVMHERRKAMVFEQCQVELDECALRKERVYSMVDGEKVRTGTIHHSVVAVTRRGSSKTVL